MSLHTPDSLRLDALTGELKTGLAGKGVISAEALNVVNPPREADTWGA